MAREKKKMDDCELDIALGIQKQVQKILGTDEVYLVGGSVRDLVMGNEPKDYDFTTPMLPDEMEKRVKAAGRRVYAIGKKFGTIGFKVPFGSSADLDLENQTMSQFSDIFHYVEVTTFRSEVYTNKSRKPEVQFVPSLDEDLSRRDFTFNAMVLKADGKIYDPYGGRLHIHSKQIKTVGMPKDRIMEDPLRILRAARFAARYNFEIDPNFIGKARQLADRIFDVSIERWVQELDKLLTSKYAEIGMKQLDLMGLWSRILPEVDFMHMPNLIENPDEAWAFLLQSGTRYNKPYNPKIRDYVNVGVCYRLKFSNDRTKIILDK